MHIKFCGDVTIAGVAADVIAGVAADVITGVAADVITGVAADVITGVADDVITGVADDVIGMAGKGVWVSVALVGVSERGVDGIEGGAVEGA